MRKLFNLEDFGTGTGFLNAELFSALLPILFIVFAVARGARSIAGEEEAGTLDVLFVTPVSPARLLLHQAAALATAVLALGAVLFATVVVSSAAFGLGIGVADLAGAVLAMVLLGVEFGWLALAVGAATGRRAVAIAVASAAAGGSLRPLRRGPAGRRGAGRGRPLSPFHQALDGGPLGAGLPLTYGWMPLAGAAVVRLALAGLRPA